MLDAFARERGTELALVDPIRQRSWAELYDRSQRIAHLLRDDLGLVAGDHVALCMRNRVEAVELLWGAVYAGIWITPINFHLAPGEMDYIVADSGSKVLFADEHVPDLDQRPERGVLRVGDELEGALAEASDAPMPLDGPAAGNMIYTSGTTGRPKGVKRRSPASVEAWLERGAASGRAVGLDGVGAHLVTGPLYHAAPLMFSVYDQLNGAPIVIMAAWDEQACLDLIAAHDIARTHLVPTMFVRLLRLPEAAREGFDPAPLKVVLHGAAPISVPVKRRMIDWWGPVLFEYWGGTEGGVNTLIDSRDWLEHPGSVGRTLPGFEVFAVDEEGRRLGSDEVGTLYCHDTRFDEPFAYHGDPQKTAGAYLEPGTFTLSDVGCVDGRGYVHLRDRASNMIISGGVNIYPAEVEKALGEHPWVADVAVFGIPDDEWGEQVKAAVELVPGVDPSDTVADEILQFVRESVAGYKVPRSVDFHDALPRQISGKLFLRELREPYWRDRDKRI
ncbi:AMP-binding protein [Myxococcota bacterium]|nr:AMP-binding protein [Myxococcota bacterium]